MPSNVIQIDHKCETGKYYPNPIYLKEHRPQFKSDKNKRRGAPSKTHTGSVISSKNEV